MCIASGIAGLFCGTSYRRIIIIDRLSVLQNGKSVSQFSCKAANAIHFSNPRFLPDKSALQNVQKSFRAERCVFMIKYHN